MNLSDLQNISILKNVYLSILKRLKSRGTTRRSLYEEYLKDRPKGYSYCSFCLYLRREREVKDVQSRVGMTQLMILPRLTQSWTELYIPHTRLSLPEIL